MKKLFINGYEISYNSFWDMFELYHKDIGVVGSYRYRSDAYADAKKG